MDNDNTVSIFKCSIQKPILESSMSMTAIANEQEEQKEQIHLPRVGMINATSSGVMTNKLSSGKAELIE